MTLSNPLTNQEGIRLSLKQILGNDYKTFLQDFIYKPVEEWLDQGKIDVLTVERLTKLVKKSGNKLFDIPAIQMKYATKHTVAGGELFRVTLPITKDLAIDNFVKLFSTKESYKRALDMQERVYTHLQGTDLENIIVPPSFTNDNKQIISYPMINASSFADACQDMNPQEKEETIKNIIDTYQRLSLNLTENKYIFQDKKGKQTLDDLLTVEKAFNKFFFQRMQDYDQLSSQGLHVPAERENLKQDINEHLAECFTEINNANNYVIHRDLIHSNVLIDEDNIKIIDMEGLSKGFLEFDYERLLTKVGVDYDAQERIISYASGNLANLEGRELTEQDIQASHKRYALNAVVQDLLTAVRYKMRSNHVKKSKIKLDFKNRRLKKTPVIEKSTALSTMADVAYTLALNRLDHVVEKSLLPGDFKEKITEYIGTFDDSLTDLGSQLGDYLKDYNPHALGSQENMASIQIKEYLLDQTDDKQKNKTLRKLKQGLKRGKNIRTWQKWTVYGAIALAAVAGASWYVMNKKTNNLEQEKIQLKKDMDLDTKVSLLQMAREKDEDIRMFLAEARIEYAEKQFKDTRTGRLFYLNHYLAIEAIRQTGSEDYDVLRPYLEENHIYFYFTVDEVIRQDGYVDTPIRMDVNKGITIKNWFKETMDLATAAYDSKFGPSKK